MKFSIITCSYNNLEGLKEVVSEVRSQKANVTPFEVEHLIIDGGSTDGTEDALHEWYKEEGIKKDNEYELKWISEPDKGLYDALNKGLKMATGDVIGVLHTDDVWESGVLARVTEAFRREASLECGSVAKDERNFRFGGEEAKLRGGESDPTEAVLQSPEGGSYVRSSLRFRTPRASIDAVYGDLLYVDAEDISKVRRVWKSGSYDSKKWFNGWMPPHPALFVTRDLATRVGDYRLDLGSAADYEWMLRAGLVHKAKFSYINDLEKQKGAARNIEHSSTSQQHVRKNVSMCGLTPFVRMRVGGQSNASVKGRLQAHDADRKAWELNGLKPRPWTLKMKLIRKIPQWLRALRP